MSFSKKTKLEKIEILTHEFCQHPKAAADLLKKYWHTDADLQSLHDDFSENTLSNFLMPFGVAPHFVVNGRNYMMPMVIEESSVVAAAAAAAKFWKTKGGFKTEVLGTEKLGQVHFMFEGDFRTLSDYFEAVKPALLVATDAITAKMRARGGGILGIDLEDLSDRLPNYYQLNVRFETKDAMGANFINSCLEAIAQRFKRPDITIVMSILSNYVPHCLVRAIVSAPVQDMTLPNMSGGEFAARLKMAVDIAAVNVHRAVTHNKGIMNGVDALVLATGNDFRAIEAGVHAYAARDGHYRSLSRCTIVEGVFELSLDLPLPIGTIGGITSLHPLSKLTIELLGKPDAPTLMQLVASLGLAQHFAALRALVTTGIQQGHMKMHLMNILNQQGATDEEKKAMVAFFADKTVSTSAVTDALSKLRAS